MYHKVRRAYAIYGVIYIRVHYNNYYLGAYKNNYSSKPGYEFILEKELEAATMTKHLAATQ